MILRIQAWSPFDISHADELMQYLEQANRIATGHGIIPWETRAGLRNSLIPQFLSVPLWIGHTFAPGTLWAMYLARATFLTATLTALPAAWRLGAFVSRRHALVALFVVAVWWESVFFSELLLSESLASALLLLAASFLLAAHAKRKASLAGGFLLGLGVLVRLQYAPFAAVLFLTAMWHTPERWRPVMGGGLGALALGAASDAIAGKVPYAWVFINFGKNIVEGKAASFGTSPVWQYFVEYYLHFGAGALLFVGLCAAAAGRRYWALLLAGAVNIGVHSLIAHKEYRFVWVSTLVFLVVAAVGSQSIVERILARHAPRLTKNAALGVMMAVWTLMSISSFHITGGYQAFRGAGAIPRLAVKAAQDPHVCRLAVVEAFYAHLVPAELPRALPLSIAPKGVYEGTDPLPPELARAANALIASERPLGTKDYRQEACLDMPQERACLYVRPGKCGSAPDYDYQTALKRGGM
ncbi:glycosyltransferase family protein [Novosphingobium beihaiensis]|uniref:Alg9-like mannosyltransferase family protein n=1 Tax=Novosphingobium beihaiensis TaxID=2930389 RepID=A0ABT0BPU1_9SPHN|nr:hypothetical protein [Novosphingobium beihaiensis]MCJ2187047.1 hypothetical protein [Novosphingobium beihaiensis]